MTEIYDRLGDTYDTTRKADPSVLEGLKRHIGLSPSGRYLDVACGTGNYTAGLNKIAGTWTGLEPSAHMLDLARKKDDTITWVRGGAESIPFEDDSFDGVMTTLAIHHFTDLDQALQEYDRVLRPGGTLVLFTATPEQVLAYWLNRYFPEMIERDVKHLPSVEEIAGQLEKTHLRIAFIEPFYITVETEDFFFFSGKYRPAMYLSERVRNGMSPFRTSISDEELARGLAALERDIDDGTINQVIEDSQNDLGDYCFIVIRLPRG